MKITKYGHCCLLIEIKGQSIMTDPGNYNELLEVLPQIDIVLLTHEHGDHVHIPHIKSILENSPQARIITHADVSKILDTSNIACETVEDGQSVMVGDVSIQSLGSVHACMHHTLVPVRNTGFMIDNKLFYPGDSFYVPTQKVEVLALPISGPWMKLEEAIEYAVQIAPKKVFPVHDGMLKQDHRLGPTRRIPTIILEPHVIEYVDMLEGDTKEF
jgi:L-ascorbate metabolism protein UlaG (beta-lactamase superfamily)